MSGEVLHHIGGRDVPGSGEATDIFNPATGSRLAMLRDAGIEQVRDAVRSAKASFESGLWASQPVKARQQCLRRIAAVIRAKETELVNLQVEEGGMVAQQVRNHVAAAAHWFDYYADYLTTAAEQAHRQTPGATVLVTREPIGVCALFSPWNVPLTLSAIKLAPALAAGNSVVLKPSEFTPRTVRKLVDLILSSGLPAGVLNLVNGRGTVTGLALAEADGVDMISFTGGSGGGRQVAAAAARRPIPCVLELGGKSATIVFKDADFDAALNGALKAAYGNNGEACLAGSRILVDSEIAERFIAAFSTRAAAMRLGDPRDADTEIGPMISAQHRDRVLSYCEGAGQDGDTLLTGGRADPGLRGFFVKPAVIQAASTRSRAWREEIFGPVATIRTFDSDEDAIAMANDSDYGLAGYIWTRNLDRALRTASRLRTGSVVINQSFLREPNAPFGGFKASGIGREGGCHSYANVTQLKATVICHG